MRLKQKLLASFLIPLVLVGGMSLVGFLGVIFYFTTISSNISTLHVVQNMSMLTREALTNIFDYDLTGNKKAIVKFTAGLNKIDENLKTYAAFRLTLSEQSFLKKLQGEYVNIQSSGSKTFDFKQKLKSDMSEFELNAEQIIYLIDRTWQPITNQAVLTENSKNFALYELEVDVQKYSAQLNRIIIGDTNVLREESILSEARTDINTWLLKLKTLSLNSQEIAWLEKIKILVERNERLSDNIIAIKHSINHDGAELIDSSNNLSDILENEAEPLAIKNMQAAKNDMFNLIYIMTLFIVLISLFSAMLTRWLSKRFILTPISILHKAADALAIGKIDEQIDINTEDELGDLARSFRSLMDNSKTLAIISDQFGRGDFDAVISPRCAEDVLSHSLLEMKSNLQALDNENKTKVFIKTQVFNVTQSIQGIRNLQKLLQVAITELAKVLHVGYGAFYLLEFNPEKTAEPCLILQATYAYMERKNLSNKFKIGESLVGECALEMKMIIVSEIPDDYIKITSGLGEKKPKVIMALPVIFENELLGVFEFATFELFNEGQKDIVNEVMGTLAIIINNVKSYAKTEELLVESQKMSEELQAQQEELKATNEELEEKAKIMKGSAEELKAQTEEIQATNEELEEKTEKLERQNRNIDQQNKEIMKAREEVEQRARDLTVASKYKSEFLANMSHELRTPLNSLLILSKNLSQNKQGNLNEKQIESATVIYKGGQDLLRLINDILDLSKVEAGKLHIEIEPVNLKSFISEIDTQFKPIVEEKGLNFKIDVSKSMPVTIDTDEQRLSQIIKNLLSNAIKFTEKGVVTLSVELSKTDEGMIIFKVTDTGIGIPKDKQRDIFEAFQQADGSTSRQFGGTGLGLAISRAMAELLGGKVFVESDVGAGSSFTLIIPLRVTINSEISELTNNTEDENITTVKSYNSGAKKTDLTTTMGESVATEEIPVYLPDDRDSLVKYKRSILLVEDDKAFAKILMESSKEKGYGCLIAGDGRTALAMARKYKPNAIILDLGLPDLDGMQVLEQLKFDLSTRHIPVHIASAREEASESKKMGAIGFLSKPATIESINEVSECVSGIETILMKSRF